MSDIEKFNALDFRKSTIDDVRVWCSDDLLCHSIGIDGTFQNNDECPYFSLGFDPFPRKIDVPEELKGAAIESLDISQQGESWSVKLVFSVNGECRELDLLCKKFSFTLMKYRGMSYRNLYSEWVKGLTKSAYVEYEKYFKDEETHELEDGFTLNIKDYSDVDEKSPNYAVMKAYLQVCELKGGDLKYRYRSTANSNPHTFFNFIHHSNGHRYFPFHISLYGMSYLDLDSGEVYHYIPEGYQHNAEWTFGESFIVTSVFYDSKTDLVAYEGCYWAGTSDVMVGDLSDPLNYDPHLVSIHQIIDPDYEEVDDVDFARFEDGRIIVKCDSKTEREVALDVINEKMKSLR